MLKKQLFIVYTISFFTAFCSLIYELQYSQLLSVLYGNSVLRYSLTIGLYLFSLGIGSLSFRLFVKIKSEKMLWISQTLLAIVGPIGVIGTIWVDNWLFHIFQSRAQNFAIILAHIPIVITGILAGIQIPLLSILGNAIKKRADMFVEVLGMDYFGSLIGAVSYGLFLYPNRGLIKTAFLVGIVNSLLALLCLVFIENKKKPAYIVMAIMMIFALLNINADRIEKSVMDMYVSVSVLKEKAVNNRNLVGMLTKMEISPDAYADPISNIKIDDYFNTPYQEVIKYTVEQNGIKDQCLKLSMHTNMCDSWANSYHDALANVPMAFLPKRTEPYHILLLGGGSLLPVKNLLNYNVTIDQVDIDEKFIDYARTDSYFVKYHQNAWQDPRIHIYFEDAFSFLRHNQKKYDLVVMSLPGFGSDKLIQLGSVEFFTFMNRAMTDSGLMVTWEYGDINEETGNVYSPYNNSKHLKTLFADIRGGGFVSYLMYNSYINAVNQSAKVPSDIFYLFQKQNINRVADLEGNEYIRNMKQYYSNMKWLQIDSLKLSDIRASHIFSPNYDILTEL